MDEAAQDVAPDSVLAWLDKLHSKLPFKALKSALERVVVPSLVKEKVLALGADVAVYSAMAREAEQIFGAPAHIKEHREVRLIESNPGIMGSFEAGTETMRIRTAGRQVMDSYLRGDFNLTGDPTRDAARTRMLGWAKNEMAVGFHESIHSVASPKIDLTTHANMWHGMPYGRVLSEGLTELANQTFLNRAIEGAGLHRIEPAILDVEYKGHYPAEVGAVRGLVDAGAAALGIPAEDVLARLVRDGRSSFTVDDLTKDMARQVVGDSYGLESTVATGLKAAMTKPLADLEQALPSIVATQENMAKAGDITAAVVRERVATVLDAARGIMADPTSYEGTKPHYEALAQVGKDEFTLSAVQPLMGGMGGGPGAITGPSGGGGGGGPGDLGRLGEIPTRRMMGAVPGDPFARLAEVPGRRLTGGPAAPQASPDTLRPKQPHHGINRGLS